MPDVDSEIINNVAKIFAVTVRTNKRLRTSPTNGDANRRKKITYLALFPGQKCQIAMFGMMRKA